MKINEAMSIIDNNKDSGYMVHFELRSKGCLISDYFPDKHAGEKLIETEDKAWDLAKKFAKSTNSDYTNIYVIDSDFRPVLNYEHKVLKLH